MTTVWLVRHGETDWNVLRRFQGREDIELNAQGRAQALMTGHFLRRYQWDALLSSPLQRAKATALIIGQCIGHPTIRELDALMERDYGAASGLTAAEAKIRFPDGMIPGIEDRTSLTDRVKAILQVLAEQYRDQHIIVVTHGGVINAILAELSHGAIGSGKTVLKNACISSISRACAKSLDKGEKYPLS